MPSNSKNDTCLEHRAWIGTVLKLRERLGSGASGEAWRADNVSNEPSLPKQLVVKRIATDISGADAAKVMQEIRVLERLDHPCVVRYYDAWIETAGGQHWANTLCIAMEFCEGGDLHQVLLECKARHRRLTSNQVVIIALQLFAAVAYAHSQKVLHRDIKPQNIFLKSKDSIVLGDFGISKSLEATHDFAHTRVGTPYYVAPEVVLGHAYNGRADLWSVGVVLYECMTLERPFEPRSKEINALYNAILRNKVGAQLRERCSAHYEKELIDLVDACLAKQQDARPSPRHALSRYAGLEKHCRELGLVFPSPSRVQSPLPQLPAVNDGSSNTRQQQQQQQQQRPVTQRGSPVPLHRPSPVRYTSPVGNGTGGQPQPPLRPLSPVANPAARQQQAGASPVRFRPTTNSPVPQQRVPHVSPVRRGAVSPLPTQLAQVRTRRSSPIPTTTTTTTTTTPAADSSANAPGATPPTTTTTTNASTPSHHNNNKECNELNNCMSTTFSASIRMWLRQDLPAATSSATASNAELQHMLGERAFLLIKLHVMLCRQDGVRPSSHDIAGLISVLCPNANTSDALEKINAIYG